MDAVAHILAPDETSQLSGFRAGASLRPRPGLKIVAEADRRIGPYRLEGILGQGGMGAVHAAYDERLDRRVALKRVLAGEDDPERRKRLRREARTAAQLAHPAVVQIFDLVEAEDGDWIVMELVEGRTLARLLETGPVSVELALAYGRQIAEGLAAAHELGIVHRDLKTENVLVLPDDRVKILDFGLAKRLVSGSQADDSLSVAGQVKGTGRAMSPEQARGLPVGPRSDLFSLGVLLYETLTGIRPFSGESFYDSLARIATHQPRPVAEIDPEVPRELSALVDRLLTKAPELRPGSARQVAAELARLADERRLRTREEGGAVAARAPDTVTRLDLPAALPRPGRETSRSFLSPTSGIAALVLALMLAGAAVVVLPRLLPGPGEAVPPDPLASHEEAMRAVRRIDRPENIDRAVEIFQRRLAREPDSAAAHAGLARAYWEKARTASAGGDPMFLEQAEGVAREAVRLDPYLADARVSLGLVHLARKRPEEARQELDRALELEPGNADAHYGLGEVADSLDRPAEAEGHYSRALTLAPATLYSDALGSLYYAQGRYEDAEERFLTSLEIAPDDVHALRNLGALYYARGRVDEAAAMFQKALTIQPNASLYSNLGTILFSRGLYPRAAEAFERALAMDGASHKPVYWINLADAYRQMPGREEEAEKSYRQAIRLLDERIEAAPDDVRLLSRRALVRARAGDRQDAAADLARLRELEAGHNVYSLFRQAVAEELTGERNRALATLEEALRAGLDPAEVRREPDLLELRAEPRFHHLLSEL